ncbi:CotH kinase family protein [Oceanihabitans sp. 2_MG-2023]|uniref:CotH kinase family protein n=1 Tax=Oceanihabitans sp. 2_MG-2023 TaxID=3062661 RepID=UPI0026E2E49C|nr:CotH kinase family protein [Oceanihabitans sp. 2_MG-2023]MDO6598132.1 CotH kinase family protein [Oceanihabitans sp. 2_MG-2023]
MKQFVQFLFSVSLLLNVLNAFAQEVIAKNGSYGIDKENRVIVWHTSNLDSLTSVNEKITSIKFDASFTLVNSKKQLSYSNINVVKGKEAYTLYISKLPLVHITIDTTTINNQYKRPGYFTLFSDTEYIKSTIGVRHRGNLSLSFPKKSFDIEFWTDSISKQKKDVKFKGMRSDDDWILDGLYNEPLRLRSYISTKLWNKIHSPYYAKKEPNAKSGFDVEFVEVFKNNSYYGLYQLSESVDRKQLKLKKNKANIIHGELYKAHSYKGGPGFTKSPAEYNNIFPHWNGWKTEYPFIDYTSDFSNLSAFTNLVVHASDKDFSQRIETNIHIENAIDYYLMVNIIRASDNMGKNYYLGKYDILEPYFFVPWDLDGVMGIIQDGKRERGVNQILSNGLFDRLLENNPNEYKAKMKSRWFTLRENAFSKEALLGSITKIYDRFTVEKIYEREQLIWINKLNDLPNTDHYEYLENWIEERLTNLDEYFKSL